MRRHTVIMLVVLMLVFMLGLAGCSNTDATSEEGEETEEIQTADPEDEGEAEADEAETDSVAGTYVGEFGAIIDLEEEGTLDLMIPIVFEVAADGSVTGSWEHSTDVPTPEIDTFETNCEFTGTLDGDTLEASGRATNILRAPIGSLTDTLGVIITGTLSGENLIGDIQGYGETEGFIATLEK